MEATSTQARYGRSIYCGKLRKRREKVVGRRPMQVSLLLLNPPTPL